MGFLAALAPLIGIGTAAGGATTVGSVMSALGALSGIASAGTTIGETIANAGGMSAQQPTPTTPTTPQGPTLQQLMQQRALIGGELPNFVSQTAGLASPGQDLWLSLLQSGQAGQPGANASGQAALGQQFTPANNAPTNPTVANQPINVSDYLNNFSGAQ